MYNIDDVLKCLQEKCKETDDLIQSHELAYKFSKDNEARWQEYGDYRMYKGQKRGIRMAIVMIQCLKMMED